MLPINLDYDKMPQESSFGISRDWYNEILPLDMMYKTRGLAAVVNHLHTHPVRNYEERRAELLARGKNNPEYCAAMEREYAIIEQNSVTVKRLNTIVRLLNLAVQQGRLTDKMYNRFISRLG